MRPHRQIAGVLFTCLSAGSWLSEDGKLAIVHMMTGTPHDQWELFVTALGKGDVKSVPDEPDDMNFLCADLVCASIDFGGRALAEDVRRLSHGRPRWKRSTGDFAESHCSRWLITPIYGGCTRPERYELRLDNEVVGAGQTQRECKAQAEDYAQEGPLVVTWERLGGFDPISSGDNARQWSHVPGARGSAPSR